MSQIVSDRGGGGQVETEKPGLHHSIFEPQGGLLMQSSQTLRA